MSKKIKISITVIQWVTVLLLHVKIFMLFRGGTEDGLMALLFFMYLPIIVAGYGVFMAFNLFFTYFLFNSKGMFTQKKL